MITPVIIPVGGSSAPSSYTYHYEDRQGVHMEVTVYTSSELKASATNDALTRKLGRTEVDSPVSWWWPVGVTLAAFFGGAGLFFLGLLFAACGWLPGGGEGDQLDAYMSGYAIWLLRGDLACWLVLLLVGTPVAVWRSRR